MRTSIGHKVYFHDLDQPEVMVAWGNPKRRKRLKPQTLLVEWRKEIDGDDWVLWHVYLMGRYVHAQADITISHTCYEYRRDGSAIWSPETAGLTWIQILTEQARPRSLKAMDIYLNGVKQEPSIDYTRVDEDLVSAWETGKSAIG